MRRYRLQGTDGHLRAPRSVRSDSRDDPRAAPDVGNQEGGTRGGHAVPARVRNRAGDAGPDHPPRDQQGHVRRMSRLAAFLGAPTPSLGIEISASRVAAVRVSPDGTPALVTGVAVEALPPGAVVPALNALNINDRAAVTGAI